MLTVGITSQANRAKPQTDYALKVRFYGLIGNLSTFSDRNDYDHQNFSPPGLLTRASVMQQYGTEPNSSAYRCF